MKRVLLISTALVFASVVAARASDPVCSSNPFNSSWCGADGNGMGYVSEASRSTEISDFSEVLRCPMGSMTSGESWVYYDPATVKSCVEGDILFSDDRCYEDDTPPSASITPKAIVFDPVNKLALELKSGTSGQTVPTYAWQSSSNNSLKLFTNNNQSRPKVLRFGSEGSPCSLGTTDAINKELCSAPDVAAGSNRCPSQYGCQIAGVTTMIRQVADFASAYPSIGGWKNTFAMVEGGSESSFSFPAAEYCYNKNLRPQTPGSIVGNSRATNNALTGKVWFLPSAVDLRTLARACPSKVDSAKNCVGKKIVDLNAASQGTYIEYGYDSKLWSSTQAYELTSGSDGNNGNGNGVSGNFYSYAVVPQASYQINGCDPVIGVNYDKVRRDAEKPVLCVYHYGEDWDMSAYESAWAIDNVDIQSNF